MLEPEERVICACKTCKDIGMVASGNRDIECPECSSWDAEQRDALLRQATRTYAEKPAIRMSDLTSEERDLVAGWRLEHPHVHELTLLTWIEGRRYDPSKDEEFLAEARKRFRKWQFRRYSFEGSPPDWARTALASGNVAGLKPNEVEYVNGLRGK